MADRYKDIPDPASASARSCRTITPHDTNPLPNVTKALLIVSGGTVVLRAVDDSADETYPDLPAYSQLPVQVSHVRATGTTATHIKALV